MFCTNCGKEQVDNPKFCRSCGTKLVQESVIQSDAKPEIKPSVEPRVNQGIQPKVQPNIEPGAVLVFQPKPRSATLKWATGLLFVLTVIYLVDWINLISLIRAGINVPALPGDFVWVFILIPAAICAAMRKHWGYARGVTIWLPITSIMGTLILFGRGQIGPLAPEDIASAIFVFLLQITCLILISRTKAEFS
jgi:hypothetical protein